VEQAAYESLSGQERACLRRFARRTAKEVARELGISEKSVETFVARGRAKIGARSGKDAAWAVVEHEATVSGPPRTDKPRQDSLAPILDLAPVDLQADVVREDRAVFHHEGERPSTIPRPMGSKGSRLHPLIQVAVLVAAALMILTTLFAAADGADRVAHWLHPRP
jgi:DNA-binding CsgD family transcriptional regulator